MTKRLIILFCLVFIARSTPISTVEAGSCTPEFPATTCSVTDKVTITATVANSTATFTGLAPASSVVTVKDNGVVAGNTTTNPGGIFSKTIISTPGLHDFTLFLTDTSGRTTPETSYLGVNLPFYIDTPINNILLPPTIDISKSTIYNGETVAIIGQGSPGSTLHIVLNSKEIYSGVLAGSDYNIPINSGYALGANNIHSFLSRTGYTNSVDSFTKVLTIGNCRRNDFNCDGRVNLTDFSILMYHWNTAGPVGDINHDGTVGLIDFSIMLYDWTN